MRLYVTSKNPSKTCMHEVITEFLQFLVCTYVEKSLSNNSRIY